MHRPRLLLIPGLLCDAALWAHQIERLGNDTEIIIADTLHDDSLTTMATRAVQRMNERYPGQPFAVAGLSMGGYVALEMWKQAPDQICGLALLDTRASSEPLENRHKRQQLMKVVQFHQRFVGMSDEQLPLYIHPSRVNDQALVAKLREMTQRVGKMVYLQQQQAIIDRQCHLNILDSINVKTLIICGESDAITPLSCSKEMASRIPGSALNVIPDCGHLSCLEKPEIVTDLLTQWLDTISS